MKFNKIFKAMICFIFVFIFIGISEVKASPQCVYKVKKPFLGIKELSITASLDDSGNITFSMSPDTKLYFFKRYYFSSNPSDDLKKLFFSDNGILICPTKESVYVKLEDGGSATTDNGIRKKVAILNEKQDGAIQVTWDDKAGDSDKVVITNNSCKINGEKAFNKTTKKIDSLIDSLRNIDSKPVAKDQFMKDFKETVNQVDSYSKKGYCYDLIKIDGKFSSKILEEKKNTLQELYNQNADKLNLTEDEKNEIDSYFNNLSSAIGVMVSQRNLSLSLPTNYNVDCGGIIDKDLADIIRWVLNVVMIGVPIGLIILVTLDFAGPVISQDNDAIKKATSKAVKRAIAAVVIFFIPVIVKAILNLDGVVNENSENPECLVNEVFDKEG